MLNRVDFAKAFTAKAYKSKNDGGFFKGSVRHSPRWARLSKSTYLPPGFMDMMFVDPTIMDRAHYDFAFVRREFLGEVRTEVFDVHPKPGNGSGRFGGCVWIVTPGRQCGSLQWLVYPTCFAASGALLGSLLQLAEQIQPDGAVAGRDLRGRGGPPRGLEARWIPCTDALLGLLPQGAEPRDAKHIGGGETMSRTRARVARMLARSKRSETGIRRRNRTCWIAWSRLG